MTDRGKLRHLWTMCSYFNVEMNKQACASGQTEPQLGRQAQPRSSSWSWTRVYLLRYASPASDLWSFPNHGQLERARCLVVRTAFTLLFMTLMFHFKNLYSLKKAKDWTSSVCHLDLSVAVTYLY